uniref:Uncharacterized protein n=1 Tax=Arundo donax TaxID=35708 RepID=A0A0A9EXA5_ARUDO
MEVNIQWRKHFFCGLVVCSFPQTLPCP